jgi:hypothetical protein
MTRPAFDRLDAGVQRRKVEPLDEAPHQAHPVIGRDQLVQAHRPQRHLPALRHAQARDADGLTLGCCLFGKLVEQGSVHGDHHSWKTIAIKLPHLVTPRRYFPALPQARGRIYRL